MRKYFGTDGIRAIANTELTPELVHKVAKAGADVLAKRNGHVPTILIGRDTRISGTLIENALVTGFLSCGANVKRLGVIPTPAVAYLTKKLNADAGVVVSASHNSYEFNGIKFFSKEGTKIPDEIEEKIEEIIESEEKLRELTVSHDKIGKVENCEELVTEYLELFEKEFMGKIPTNKEFKVVVDTANGATYKIAQEVFEKLGIQYEIINNNPNGININDNCGSTHLKGLKEYVLEHKMSLGIAYDGDGDRCLAVDEQGNEIDGDGFLTLISNYMKEQGTLKQNTFVATIMSNLGLNRYAEENDLKVIQTKVGDRYVLEEMLKQGYNLGGEQSGHMILLDYNPTGDGILTSLMFIKILLEKNMMPSDVWQLIKKYPQVLVNVSVDNDKKYDYNKYKEINEAIQKLEEEFMGQGRVIIRASGTEPLVRVMIEGKDKQYITQKANEIATLIKTKLN